MTSGVEALSIVYAALTPEEQEEAFAQLRERRIDAQGDAEREMESHVRSLRRVAEAIGHAPGVTEYREVSQALIAGGEEVEPFSRLYRYFGKSWGRAQEALELSGETTTRAIEARFAHRRLGKPVRYSEDVLRVTLAKAVESFGRPPNTSEYTWWRERQLELARAQGEERPHLPTDGPYRDRWKSWEAALLHFGYTPDAIAHRLERKEQVFFSAADPYLPDDLPVAELAVEMPEGLALSEGEAERVRECYDGMPRRTRYVLTVRLGLGGERKRILREVGEALGVHLSRIQQLQLYALDALVESVGEKKHARAGLRADVIEGLRLMADGVGASKGK
jgi:DNA-directed RNA polymerase specialized sigma24 family protein